MSFRASNKYINIVILTGFGFGQKFDTDQLMLNL